MSESLLDRFARTRILGKSPVGVLLRVGEWMWNHLPIRAIEVWPVRSCGHIVHEMVCRLANRRQYFGTFFFRNRPQLKLIRRVSYRKERGSTLRMAVLGCSNGVEVYSLLATIRSGSHDLHVIMQAVDISAAVLDLARKGVYSFKSPELVDEPIFERMTEVEIEEMCDVDEDIVRIRPWVKEGITWHVGDAGEPGLCERLGLQHIVVANNFLCHMKRPDAERCLRQIARFVTPGGHLVVAGIDLDVRERVAADLKWKPVTELLEEIHDGDWVVRRDWPWKYWGLEPLDRRRKNWMIRYATVFQLGEQEVRENRLDAAVAGHELESTCVN